MKVLKFGGTSVQSASMMKKVSDIISSEDAQIIVLSAMSGITNQLLAITNHLQKNEISKCLEILEKVNLAHHTVIYELLSDETHRKKAIQNIQFYIERAKQLIQHSLNKQIANELLSFGEQMSTSIFYEYQMMLGRKVYFLPALNFMRLNADKEPDMQKINVLLQNLIPNTSAGELYITQGFIALNENDEIDNLGRGGSDYSATIIGAALQADVIEIWTDIDGVHNNDPRYVENTYPLRELSYNEAAELAYFGAKILHPTCIVPAQKTKIPIFLKNTMEPMAAGTIITQNSNKQNIKAIAAKDGIIAIRIHSSRMLNAYGFLRKVFEIFEKHKTPIDLITTSEVSVSVTIDDDKQLFEILNELKDFGTVEVDRNQSIVCIVGDFLAANKGIAAQILNSINEIPLRMVSYGGSDNNISLLINCDDKIKTLKLLNSKLFTKQVDEIFKQN